MKVIGRHAGLTEAEKKVLNWLEVGLADEDGEILVELPLKAQLDKYFKWPDFLIVSPTHGVCILECKGYYSKVIRRTSKAEDLLLISEDIDRYQLQLRGYGLLIRNLLKGTNIPQTKCVIFPLIKESDPAASGIQEIHKDSKDTTLMFEDITNRTCSLDKFFAKPMDKKLKKAEFDEIKYLLNPERVIDHNYCVDLDSVHKKVLLFDEEQFSYIKRIKSEGHYLFNGLPGTGKTKMLIKLAERELANNRSVLYTCFNKALNNTVVEYLGENHSRTTNSIYWHEGKKYNFFEKGDGWQERLLARLEEVEVVPQFDVILIDEYQDLTHPEFALFLKLLKPNGLLVLAGDRLQNIGSAHETWKSKGLNIPGAHSMFLKVPYRVHSDVVDFGLKFISINKALAKEAKRYFLDHDFDHNFGNFSELSNHVTFFNNEELQPQFKIREIIELNPEAKVLLVTCYEGQEKQLNLNENPNLQIVPFSKVKGLEADIVILYCVDYYTNPTPHMTSEQKMRAVFSALCRSRGHVYIHGSKKEGFYADLWDEYLVCLGLKKAA